MEKGWWGESPPSDRQNRLPEPEQHGGACPGGRQPVPAGVLLCCAPAPDPSGDRAASGREPSAPCPASEDWHRSFCPSHREYGQKGAALYRKFFSWLLPCTPALARRDIFTGRGTAPPGSAPGFCPYPSPRPPGHFYRERASPARLTAGLLPRTPALARRWFFLPLLQERPGRSGKNPAESGF